LLWKTISICEEKIMSYEEEGYLIVGVAPNGNTFRPSDWVERIATLYARFDANQRIYYNPMVKPVHAEGRRCLFVARALAEQNPVAYGFIMDFADSNHLQVLSTAPEALSNVA
jgi:hypothetical protein